jgi:hypothetical protein
MEGQMRIETEAHSPGDEHGKDGLKYHEDETFEGWVVVCLCGERFMDEGDLERHIEEHTPGATKAPTVSHYTAITRF